VFSKQLIYGSEAVNHWFPDFPREPKDRDFIVLGVPYNKEHHFYEATNNTDNTAGIKFEYFSAKELDYVFEINSDPKYVDPDLLYTIKMSHSFWDVKWDKTIHDILFLQSKGCKLNRELYLKLYQLWTNVHRKKSVNMNKANSEFFKDKITRKFNHDFLHEQFAFYKRPLNETIRPDIDRTWCSEELFNKLSEEDKLKCALEEVYVIAYERFSIGNVPIKLSIIKALKQLITTMTKGWFALYLVLHFKEIIRFPIVEYQNKINKLEGITWN
jgi:hypothetical protein